MEDVSFLLILNYALIVERESHTMQQGQGLYL